MNRIILLGNGFDLAHGLKTGYEDFINWYWEKWGQKLRTYSGKVTEDMFCSFRLKEDIGLAGWYLVWSYRYQILLKQYSNRELAEIAINDKEMCDFKTLSVFFSRICKTIKSKGWVDIENEYYNLLKESVSHSESAKCSYIEINNQLEKLLQLLTQYLGSLPYDKISPYEPLRTLIYEPMRIDDISIKGLNHFYEHCNNWAKQDRFSWYDQMARYGIKDGQASILRVEIDEFLEKFVDRSLGPPFITDYSKFPHQFLRPNNTLLLSFNYTNLSDLYESNGLGSTIHIHGNLDSPSSMIFGYGDELDEEYKDLLKRSDNECLKNIKSIRYLESSNYRKLLQFIESTPYQVYIMGHSCGNSDRTLLNTLFEHRNCVSIKPYYYQKEDGSDNYIEIVQNICRNFTDMKLMRDRVVNKTFCEPLPQSKTNERI